MCAEQLSLPGLPARERNLSRDRAGMRRHRRFAFSLRLRIGHSYHGSGVNGSRMSEQVSDRVMRSEGVIDRVGESAVADDRPSTAARLVAIVRSLRPKQWTKNLLVFAGLVFTYNLLNPGMLSRVMLSFVAFCMLSSAGYIWNDLRDVAADRLHP